MRTIHKLSALIAAGAMIMAALAGCGSPASASAPVEVSGGVYPAVPPGTGLLLSWRVSGGELRVVDLKTGKDSAGYEPMQVGMAAMTALSPDGETLAVYVSPNNNLPVGGSLHLIDLVKWEDYDTKIDIREYPSFMTYSPDGRYIVIGYTEQSAILKPHMALVDADTQKLVMDVLTTAPARLVQFTADSQRIVTYGASWNAVKTMEEAVPHAAVYTVPDLAVEWETTLTGIVDGMIFSQQETSPYYSWSPGAVFSRDGEMLYVVHAHQDWLTKLNLMTHQFSQSRIGPQMTLLDQLMALGAGTAQAKMLDGTTKQAVLSPNGTRLYVSTEVMKTLQTGADFQVEMTHPDSVKVIDTATGAEIGLVASDAGRLILSADGAQLYAYGYDYNTYAEWTDVIDAQNLKAVGRISGWMVNPARLPDGRSVLLGVKDGKVAVFDSATLEVISEWREDGWSTWIVGQ